MIIRSRTEMIFVDRCTFIGMTSDDLGNLRCVFHFVGGEIVTMTFLPEVIETLLQFLTTGGSYYDARLGVAG